MIYIDTADGYQPGYHTFQVYDERGPDGEPYDPDVLVCVTRAELVRAIEAIDLHTNAVMVDECDEDPPADATLTFASPCDADGFDARGHAWLPEPGQRVRVVWRYCDDEAPYVDDVITGQPDHDTTEYAGSREPRRSERCVSGVCSEWDGSRLMRVVPA